MEEKEINPQESLDIITKMVDRAKQNYSADSFYYIMWGWLVFVAALLSYFLSPILKGNIGLIWLLMPLGGVVSFIYGYKNNKIQKIKTHVETSINNVWLTLGLAFISVMIATALGQMFDFLPVFILLYGIGIFLTGRFLQFLPMIIGGSLCFPLFILCLYFSILDENNYLKQYLVLAIAILVSYIVPGHLLKAKYKK
jgi:hypothetical protein